MHKLNQTMLIDPETFIIETDFFPFVLRHGLRYDKEEKSAPRNQPKKCH